MPLVATGVVLYGAYLVLVSAVARMGKTGSLFPVAAAGLAVNIALGFLLIPSRGSSAPASSLIGAYLVLLTLMYFRARAALGLVLEFRRIAQIVAVAAAVAFSGEYLLPEDGLDGLAMRVGVVAALPARTAADRLLQPHRDRAARATSARY